MSPDPNCFSGVQRKVRRNLIRRGSLLKRKKFRAGRHFVMYHSAVSVPYPPFTGLRAFEAAARHRSFRRAAEELHLTESAVSHDIRRLETWFGLQLFLRERSGLVLTNKAVQLFDQVHDCLGQLAAVTTRLRCIETADIDAQRAADFCRQLANPAAGQLRACATQPRGAAARLQACRRPVHRGDRRSHPLRQGAVAQTALRPADRGMRVSRLQPGAADQGSVPAPPQRFEWFRLLHDSRHGGEWERWLAALHAEGVDAAAGHKLECPPCCCAPPRRGWGSR